MTTEQNSSGTIIRGADGSLYFIREEVLEACKITEEDMAGFCSELLEEHSGDVSGFSHFSSALPMTGPFQTSRSPIASFDARATSTVMCPGSMKSGSFVINPAINQQRFR